MFAAGCEISQLDPAGSALPPERAAGHRRCMLDATATARRLPRLALRAVTVLSCALTALAVTATAASASVGATRYAEGLHLSTGALVDPAGRAWVADHNAGFCRVSSPTDAGPGTIEHPRTPGAAGPKTCLGGLLPDAAPGPNAAGQPVFVDPTPDWPSSGDEVALIPDGASPSSQLVRARWNPFSQRFTYLDTITMQGARGRPTTLSVGPDDAVYVGFQRETTIQRVRDAWAPAPIVETVGRTADGKGPLAVGAGRDAAGDLRVYVAESPGLRVLDPSPAAPTTTASPVDLGATTVGAMFYDDQADALYVGTADGAGEVPGAQRAEIDRLIRIDARTGAVDDAYATGFSMVGGIGEAAGGNLFVADDPALLDPAEPIGTGRLWHVGLPVAHVTAGPLDDAGATGRDHHTADSTPTFQVAGDGTVQCKLS